MSCSAMSQKPEPESSLSSAETAALPPQAMRAFWGSGLMVVRVKLARMQAPPPPPAPSATHSALSVVL